jgi:hypothetical protein
MNKKQKVLTICALVAFVAYLVLLTYDANTVAIITLRRYWATDPSREIGQDWELTIPALVLVMLGVIYTGLFFLLADKKGKR